MEEKNTQNATYGDDQQRFENSHKVQIELFKF